MRCESRFVVLVWMVLGAWTALAAEEDSVKVEKGEVTVEYKRFDPEHLPSPPPPLEKGEAAVCVYQFGVETDVRCTYSVPAGAAGAAAPKGPVKLDVKLTRVTVKLSLGVTIWLPKDADARLTAHEEGHRSIAEHYYASADRGAREVAQRVAGTTVKAEGRDASAAVHEAIDGANKRLCDECMAGLSKPCERAQRAFDRLTDHSRKEPPTAKEAIGLAIKEAEKK
jgi:hypothetical protein